MTQTKAARLPRELLVPTKEVTIREESYNGVAYPRIGGIFLTLALKAMSTRITTELVVISK
jgi:hypothetical protein